MHYVDRFQSLVSRISGAYVCAVHAYAGLKTPEGVHLLSGRVLFQRTRPPANEPPFSLETSHIVAGKFFREAGQDSFATTMARARIGQIDTPKGPISLTPDDPSRGFDDHFFPISSPFAANFSVRGKSWHNLLTNSNSSPDLSWDLKTADTPFDSMDELLGRCGLPAVAQSGSNTVLEISAGSPGVIASGSKIVDGEAVIECCTTNLIMRFLRLKKG